MCWYHDTVICLGDVTMNRPTDGLIDHVSGADPATRSSWQETTTTRTSAASDGRSTRWRRAPTWQGEPHLLFTHVPLDDIPAGCVNVHGHVHRKTSVDEHRINVCVEQIGYQLIPMADVRKLACRLDQAPLGGVATTDLFIAWAKDWPDAGTAAGQGDAP